MSYENAVKQIKGTYREDMATEIIRILDKEVIEQVERCRWALVFTDVAEAEKAREKLSWRNIYPDSQEDRKLLWINREDVENARKYVGGLIEAHRLYHPTPREISKPLIPEKAKEEIAEAAEREDGGVLYSVCIFHTRPEYGEDVEFFNTYTARTKKGTDYLKDIMTKAFTKAHPTWTIKRASVKQEE